MKKNHKVTYPAAGTQLGQLNIILFNFLTLTVSTKLMRDLLYVTNQCQHIKCFLIVTELQLCVSLHVQSQKESTQEYNRVRALEPL